VVKESKLNSHPNVLPIIQVSEALFPLCIMSPWMPDGNITQYTRVNPDADRPMLVGAHWPEIDGDNLLSPPAIACTGVPWPHAPSWVGDFTR